jgi:glutathione S-transferase
VWFAGDAYTLADVAFAPLVARRAAHAGLEAPANVLSWLDRMEGRPAYRASGGLREPKPRQS